MNKQTNVSHTHTTTQKKNEEKKIMYIEKKVQKGILSLDIIDNIYLFIYRMTKNMGSLLERSLM